MFYPLENMLMKYYYSKVDNAKRVLQEDIVSNYFDILCLSESQYYYNINMECLIRKLWKNIQANANIINALP